MSACTVEVPVGHEVFDVQRVARVPDHFRTQVDILFVVDDSRGAAHARAEALGLWQALRRRLAFAEAGFPSVRLGVVTSDLGVGAAAVPGCTATGDDGALRIGPEGRRWVDLGPADLEWADWWVSTRLDVEDAGCPLEQPLRAMQRALDGSQPLNDGFLRPDAALVVVFASADDDCSVVDDEFFAGGLEEYKCFQDGVVCEGVDDVLGIQPGEHAGCTPAPYPRYLTAMSPPAEVLKVLEDQGRDVVVAGIIGGAATITINEDRSVAPSCAPASDAQLYPGVRLGGFVDGLTADGAASHVADACAGPADAQIGDATGEDVRGALGHRCLEGLIRDVDGDPGLQVECTVTAIDADGRSREVPACANPSRMWEADGECYGLLNGGCDDFPSKLAVWVNWGGSDAEKRQTPPGTTVDVHCLIDGTPPVVD